MASNEKEGSTLKIHSEADLDGKIIEISMDSYENLSIYLDTVMESSNVCPNIVASNFNSVAKEDLQLDHNSPKIQDNLMTEISIDAEEDVIEKPQANLKSTFTDCSNISTEKQHILLKMDEPLNFLGEQHSAVKARLEDSKRVLEDSSTNLKEAKRVKTELPVFHQRENSCKQSCPGPSITVHADQTPSTSRQVSEISEVKSNETLLNFPNGSQNKGWYKNRLNLSKKPTVNDNLNIKTSISSYFCKSCRSYFASTEILLCHMKDKHNMVFNVHTKKFSRRNVYFFLRPASKFKRS